MRWSPKTLRKTTEKREEQAFLAERIGTLHHGVQPKRRGLEGSIAPGDRNSKSPVGAPDDIGREAWQRGSPGSKMGPIVYN